MKFQDLVKLEPQLQQLADRIIEETADAGAGFCANEAWYARYKPVLLKLAGWLSDNPATKTEEAYDIAYDFLTELLPECDHEPTEYCM